MYYMVEVNGKDVHEDIQEIEIENSSDAEILISALTERFKEDANTVEADEVYVTIRDYSNSHGETYPEDDFDDVEITNMSEAQKVIDYFNSIFKREAVSDLEADLLKLLGTYTEACKVNNINMAEFVGELDDAADGNLSALWYNSNCF